MGIIRITALEIFYHPQDLHFQITRGDNPELCGLRISRGPGHNFKLLISGQATKSREEIVELVEGILRIAGQAGSEALPVSRGGVENCLTSTQIEQIISRLRSSDEVFTYSQSSQTP